MTRPPPTLLEISPSGDQCDWDTATAIKHFLGKSQEDAFHLFVGATLGHFEDLMYMGPVAFVYYLEPAVRYIESEPLGGAFCAAEFGFLALPIEGQLRDHPEIIPDCCETVKRFCNHVLNHWDRHEIDEEIYHDLQGRIQAIALLAGGNGEGAAD